MSRPRRTLSLDGVTTVGAGDELALSGRTQVAMYVDSDDPTGLSVEARGSVDDGLTFGPIYNNDGQCLTLTADQLGPDGTGMAIAHHVVGSHVRAEITGAPAGATSVYIVASTGTNAGYQFREV